MLVGTLRRRGHVQRRYYNGYETHTAGLTGSRQDNVRVCCEQCRCEQCHEPAGRQPVDTPSDSPSQEHPTALCRRTSGNLQAETRARLGAGNHTRMQMAGGEGRRFCCVSELSRQPRQTSAWRGPETSVQLCGLSHSQNVQTLMGPPTRHVSTSTKRLNGYRTTPK
jgi:hypothetical protein